MLKKCMKFGTSIYAIYISNTVECKGKKKE